MYAWYKVIQDQISRSVVYSGIKCGATSDCCSQKVQSIRIDCCRAKQRCGLISVRTITTRLQGLCNYFLFWALAMSLQLFAPSSASSRHSASSTRSGVSGWSQVSGKSLGLGAKTKSSLFLCDAKSSCCLGLIGNENLLIGGKPVGECGTSHQGG